MKDYVSLHNHTSWSLMHSIIKPETLFQRAKELGQSAIAVTDSGTLVAAWDALKASKKTGVKLIMGCEFFFVDDLDDESAKITHINLFAKNHTGYKNLLLLNKLANDNNIIIFGKVVPRIDWALLERCSDGVFCTTSCGGGILAHPINTRKNDEAFEKASRLQGIFGDDLAFEIQPHAMVRNASPYNDYEDQMLVNHRLIKFGDALGVKVIAATDSHYLHKSQWKAHDTILSIDSKLPVRASARLKYTVPEFYVKSREEVESFFRRHYGDRAAEFCDNTLYFANKCEEPDWIDPKWSNPSGKELPQFPVKDQEDYAEYRQWLTTKPSSVQTLDEDITYLRYLCSKGSRELVPQGKEKEYKDRLILELDVIESLGFSSYILIVADIIDFCRKRNYPYAPGRGSVGGCLVAYIIGIHQADPIKYGLIFERFLNKEKKSYPDIDCDFASHVKKLVQKYIKEKYGDEYVAHVSNINTITPKVYAKDMARAYEFGGSRKEAVEIGASIADSIPDGVSSVSKALEDYPLFGEFAERYPELKEFAEDVGGLPRAWSTHAGGLIIGKRPLHEIVPLRRDKEGNLCIEYEKDRAEENGLVKMDILGVSTLNVMDNTLFIAKSMGKEIPDVYWDFDSNDHKTYELISRGDTLCIFQLGTSGGTIDLCRKVQPKCLEDLAIINALARPSSRDIRKNFIKTKNGEIPLELMDDTLERAFRETYGFGLYEECLMYLAQDVAGWDLNRADRLRKLTKNKGKNPGMIKKWRTEFIADSVKQGVKESKATEIWDQVVDKFQGYGFNKSLYFSQSVDVYTNNGTFICQKAIKDIIPGEYVRSYDERSDKEIFIQVKEIHDHGILPLVEIEISDGIKVRCTMNHKFRVKENGQMLPLWKIIEEKLSIVVDAAEKNTNLSNIISIKSVGAHQTYDIELDHVDHQFYLSNGVLTSNSHAIFYSMLGYQTAFLKAHFPVEFLTANLILEDDSNAKISEKNISRIKREMRKNGINILPPNINKSGKAYKILDDHTLLTGFSSIKYMGKDAIPDLLEKQPFQSFEDFMLRVDARKTGIRAIQAMISCGCFDSFGMTRKQMYLYSKDYRDKLKAFKKRSPDKEFNYPWPKDIGEWSDPEKYAMEVYYMGESFCCNMKEAYPKFFDSWAIELSELPNIFPDSGDPNDNTFLSRNDGVVEGVISDYFEFKVKKEGSKIFGETMARVDIEDMWGNIASMVLFPSGLEHFHKRLRLLTGGKAKLEPGIGVHLNVKLNWYEGDISMIFQDLTKAAPLPSMPSDKEHKKISMRAVSKAKSAKKLNPDKYLDLVEDELVLAGHSTIDRSNL